MTFKTLKTITFTAAMTCAASFVLIAPSASAGNMCHCNNNASGITKEKVGTVSVYRGPAVSYNYGAAVNVASRP